MKLLKCLLTVGVLALAVNAYADTYQTYNLQWSGAPFANGATGTGQITIDLTTLPNPGGPAYDMYPDMTSLTVTISGASSGNGTWTMADLQPISNLGTYTYWDTGGVMLNMATQLVGQPTTGNLWGTPDGISGDFNLFFGSGGPIGSFYFTLTTSSGSGDSLVLTSFAPANSIPEPGTLALAGSGIMLLAGTIRRKLVR